MFILSSSSAISTISSLRKASLFMATMSRILSALPFPMTLSAAIRAFSISSVVTDMFSNWSVEEMGLIWRMEKSGIPECSMFTANSISTGSDMVAVPSFNTSSTIWGRGIISYFTTPLKVRLLKPSSYGFSETKPSLLITDITPITERGHLFASLNGFWTRLSISESGEKGAFLSRA